MPHLAPSSFTCSLNVILSFLGGEPRLALQEPLLDREPGTMSLGQCEDERASCENAVLTQLSHLGLQKPYENEVFETSEGRDFFMAFLDAGSLQVELHPIRYPIVAAYDDCDLADMPNRRTQSQE